MDHIREHRSVLAAAEKRLLIAIARRLPSWINSDHLTLFGLLSLLTAGAALTAIPSTPWAAVAFVLALAGNWFGDSLDGTLARVRCQPRPRYGYYVDHVIDLAGTAALLSGVAASGLMHLPVALAVIAAYGLVSAETFLATHTVGVFRLSFAGIGPTELHPACRWRHRSRTRSVGRDGRPARAAARRQRHHHDRGPRDRVPGVSGPQHADVVSGGAVAVMRHRVRAFAAVGALGFVLQVAALWVLISLAHWTWLPATLVAVELAIATTSCGTSGGRGAIVAPAVQAGDSCGSTRPRT